MVSGPYVLLYDVGQRSHTKRPTVPPRTWSAGVGATPPWAASFEEREMSPEEIEKLMDSTKPRGEDEATYIVSPTVLKKLRDWVWGYKIVGPKEKRK